MNLRPAEREEVATELKRFASDRNLTDDQEQKLNVALTEAREKIAEYMQQNPNTTKADVISKVVANRDAIRQRVVSFLSPEQLKKLGRRKSQSQGLRGPEDRSLKDSPCTEVLHLGGRRSTLPATNPLFAGFELTEGKNARRVRFVAGVTSR